MENSIEKVSVMYRDVEIIYVEPSACVSRIWNVTLPDKRFAYFDGLQRAKNFVDLHYSSLEFKRFNVTLSKHLEKYKFANDDSLFPGEVFTVVNIVYTNNDESKTKYYLQHLDNGRLKYNMYLLTEQDFFNYFILEDIDEVWYKETRQLEKEEQKLQNKREDLLWKRKGEMQKYLLSLNSNLKENN